MAPVLAPIGGSSSFHVTPQRFGLQSCYFVVVISSVPQNHVVQAVLFSRLFNSNSCVQR
jgi:hypothetical protein